MTKAEIAIQTLAEVRGCSVEEATAFIERFLENRPDKQHYYKKLTDEEARKWREGFKKEQSGILAWYVRECMKVAKRSGHA